MDIAARQDKVAGHKAVVQGKASVGLVQVHNNHRCGGDNSGLGSDMVMASRHRTYRAAEEIEHAPGEEIWVHSLCRTAEVRRRRICSFFTFGVEGQEIQVRVKALKSEDVEE